MENVLKHPLVLIFSFFILLFGYSKTGPKIPFSIVSQDRGAPLVVEGTGKVAVVPDIAKVTLGIEESGNSLAAVQKSANEKSKKLVDEIKKMGIDEKDVKTISYNVFPEYDYEAQPLKIRGYRVSISYEAKVRDFDKINDVVVAATGNGANTVGNISFEVNDETKKEKLNEARKIAVEEAKQKAKSLADAAGVSLGRIINISEFPSGITPIPMVLREEGTGGTLPPTPDIKPGESELSISVSLSFEIR